MRNAFGKTIAKIYAQNSQHHLFCGDIGYGIFDKLLEVAPEQFHNFGISEQHMVSFAASFAFSTQATSVVYTINPFITSRVHDQLRIDVAYAKAPLIVCSVGAGFAYDNLGFTHYGLDDLALICSLPNFQVYTPSQPSDVCIILEQLFSTPKLQSPAYVRLQKGGEPSLTDMFPGSTDREGCRYWSGSDLEVVTHGAITLEALKAREILKDRVSIAVTSVIDWAKFLGRNAQTLDRVIFVEEHRDTGLLAHKLLNKGFGGIAYEIACVNNSEFEECTSRNSALQSNMLDYISLVDRIVSLNSKRRTLRP